MQRLSKAGSRNEDGVLTPPRDQELGPRQDTISPSQEGSDLFFVQPAAQLLLATFSVEST